MKWSSKMKYLWLLLAMISASVGNVGAENAPDFYAHWGDGKAELSSYDVVQARYRQMREGQGVMIFVTEDIHRDTYIKVESPTPQEKKIYALKLNNILKFNTGIYDYSVMTSVFSEVEAEGRPFALRKISLSVQEWCGHVFDEVLLRDNKLKGQLNSYFESEGKSEYQLTIGKNFASEDHLLIAMRELKGPLLAAGQSMDVELLPSLWSRRTSHKTHDLVAAKITKAPAEMVQLKSGAVAAHLWTIDIAGENWRKIWIERAYPHRILRWENSDGGWGEIKKTIRVPYWSLNSNADEIYRKELGLTR